MLLTTLILLVSIILMVTGAFIYRKNSKSDKGIFLFFPGAFIFLGVLSNKIIDHFGENSRITLIIVFTIIGLIMAGVAVRESFKTRENN